MLTHAATKIYTDHIRKPLSKVLFGKKSLSLLTRCELQNRTRDDILQYCLVGESECVHVSEPMYADELPTTLRKMIGTWNLTSSFVIELADVNLVGPNALTISQENEYLLENAEGSSNRITDELLRTVKGGVLPRYRDGSPDYDYLVSLVGPWSREFFHWFADYLPQLRQIETYEAMTGKRPHILIPSSPPNWLIESLDLLDVSPDRRIRWTGGRLHINRLVVPSLPHQTEAVAPTRGYIHSPLALAKLTERIKSAISPTDRPTDLGTRFYVSREGQLTRNVHNEDALMSLLSDYGFEKVRPEKWTLREQIAAFAEAEIVVGPHGAGLLNVAYADDAALVELFGQRTVPCFFEIASGLGIRYGAVQGEQVGEEINVSPSRVETALQRVLN